MTTVNPPKPRPRAWWLRQAFSALLVLGVGVALIAAIGIAQRMGLLASGGSISSDVGGAEVQVHTCPMHPQIRQPGPGRCPICGMPLVPATSRAVDEDELAVTITPAARRLANIQTQPVRREPLVTTIETVGTIAIDESRMSTVSSYIDGRIERLFADYTGVHVAKGDHLAIVYSPELYAAQVEYLESRAADIDPRTPALDAVREARKKLASGARQRLVELGMTSEQIADLESSAQAMSRLTIYSPAGGTVIEKMVQEGRYVKTGEPIYRIADLSTVWLMLELYPEDAARIRFGQRVEAELQSLPGRTFTGRVAFIDPVVDARSRSVGVRVEFLNEDGRLRPGDYATASVFLAIGQQGEVYDEELAGRWISPMHPQIIRDEPGQCPICGMDLVPTTRFGYSDTPVQQPDSLYIPRSAVLMAGSDSVVYVETQPGRFEIRPVTLGAILKDRVVILDGVEAGENVATAGNFLIDSQMQLAGKPSLIDPARAVAAKTDRPEFQEQPLQFDDSFVMSISGEAGEELEQLFGAYDAIQTSLANDQPPSAKDATALHELAAKLAALDELPAAVREQLSIVADNSPHLHHLPIDDARLQAFRPISHAIVTLASQVRGAKATAPLHHMHCPMVKGGGGDWLQATDILRNPYYGSQMPRCGSHVRQFPAAETPPGADAKPTE
ncbi:MAG: efflux RND transporter periplasmic adaptor subunit [Planctomycetaceae bacterium]